MDPAFVCRQIPLDLEDTLLNNFGALPYYDEPAWH
jgi:hypothetical protein